MRMTDFTPLWRSTIGFDHLADLVNGLSHETAETYPPYDIERSGDDAYRITLALAGFDPSEVTVTAEQNTLTIEGKKAGKDEGQYLHHGIAARPFRRVFNLADYVQVKHARFENGLLEIELVREVPEAMKPRRILINGVKPQFVEKKAA